MATETGSWGPQNLSAFSQVNFFEYPAPVSGEYSVSVSTTGLVNAGASDYLTITRNGTNVDTSAPTAPPNRSYTGNFTAGDIIRATALVMAARTNVTASWTITAPAGPLTPVTPQDPTFLDEEPWVVLPSQVGVTYSTSGTPGWDSSVTVTATADEGYVITGWFTWTKTWDARPLPSNALIQDDIDMVYFGNQWAEALYRGGMVVWEFVTPKITTFSLTEMEEGQHFSQQINTNFEVVSWSAEGLPAGLSLSQSGLLSGTPTAESSGFVTITANGIGPRTAQESYMWSVVKGGPYSDAKVYLDFNNPANPALNKGTATQPVSIVGTLATEQDYLRSVTGSSLNVTTPPGSNWTNGFSFTAWVRNIASNSGWKTLMWRTSPSAPYQNETYVVFSTNTVGAEVFVGIKQGSRHLERTSGQLIPLGATWNHVAVSVSRVSSTVFNVRIYINGSQVATHNPDGYPANAGFLAAENLLRMTGDYIGDIDDYAIWDRPISAQEVSDVYNTGRSWLPSITTTSLPNFAINEYAYFSFVDDFNADSWSATGVPAGMSMSTVGVLSGTPTTASSGTITVTATRTSTGQSATKSFSWSVVDIPALTNRSITASGANKVSHTGWSKPALTWSLTAGSGGTFNSDGTLVMLYGEGRVRFTATLNASRQARIVSNIKGVLVTSASTSSHNISSSRLVFEAGERIHIELNGYTSNTSDRFTLASEP